MVLLASSTNIDKNKGKRKKEREVRVLCWKQSSLESFHCFIFLKKKSKTGHFDPTGTEGREEEAETAFRNMTHIR